MTDEFNTLLEEDLAGRALQVGQVVDGTVVQISEDGVFVDIGAKSEGHLDLDQIVQEELARLRVGDQIKCRIVKKVDGEFKLSKKSVDFDEAWNRLKAIKDVDGDVDIRVIEKVKNGYMADVFGILPGFIHHSNFKGKPPIGGEFSAKILDLNRKARKLVFTRRDILQVEEREALTRDYDVLQEGMVVEGVVEKLSPYGAFIKITEHLTGLLHISEFSFDHVKKPSEVLKKGDVVQVKVMQIDREGHKISLSRKATLKDPLMTLLPGEEMDGVVDRVADFGVFVRLEGGITGLVHRTELTYKKFDHPSEVVKPGDQLRVKILRVQPEDRRVSLSAKASERDPWSEVFSFYSNGQSVTGKVTQLLQSGMVVKLDETFEAFVPVSEMSEDRVQHPGDLFQEGQEVTGTILSIDTAKRRIRVGLRERREFRASDDAPRQHTGRSGGDAGYELGSITPTAGKVTLGDILGSKLDLTGSKPKDASGADQDGDDEPAGSSQMASADVSAGADDSASADESASANEPESADESESAEEPATEEDDAEAENSAAEEEGAS